MSCFIIFHVAVHLVNTDELYLLIRTVGYLSSQPAPAVKSGVYWHPFQSYDSATSVKSETGFVLLVYNDRDLSFFFFFCLCAECGTIVSLI